ncbi:MAG: hypothetical protein KKH95_00730, partial [Gammaproteobacteria bacterium]|nr:hypothetical protein [Gammaproteobacteria bacterium]
MTRHTLVTAMLLALLNQQAWAESGRSDYDIDDNGLIEINDLADLNEIRNNLNGSSLYGESAGCPVTGCNGFELTTDLDFDTNGNGNIDAGDAYWNNGEGWQPIGSGSSPFSAHLNGNNMKIRNLTILRNTAEGIGLFGVLNNAEVSDLEIYTSQTGVTGSSCTGLIVGEMTNSSAIRHSHANGKINGSGEGTGTLAGCVWESSIVEDSSAVADITSTDRVVGGLIGSLKNSSIVTRSYSSGRVETSNSYAGGLVGYAEDNVQIIATYATTDVSGTRLVGGLVGDIRYGGLVSTSFSTGSISYSGDSAGGLIGVAVQSNISNSYSSSSISGTGNPVGGIIGVADSTEIKNSYWTLIDSNPTSSLGSGSNSAEIGVAGVNIEELQCPTSFDNNDCSALPLYVNWAEMTDPNGTVYWDIGTNKQLPALRLNGIVHRDSDNDGIFDSEDIFPYDFDNDGLPDITDQDDDNDGLPDYIDFQPYNVLNANSTDSDFDGIDDAEDIDRDNDGLIEISSWENLTQFREAVHGNIQLDTTGCPSSVCLGFELVSNLNFDTNQDHVINADDSYWNDGLGWEPIGYYLDDENNASFFGIVEGNGFTISNLYINRPDQNAVGLFGAVGSRSEIRNLGLTGPLMNINGKDYVGGLAGIAAGSKITAVYTTGKISGQQFVGGIAGFFWTNELRGSYATGNISGNNAVGGLVGLLSGFSGANDVRIFESYSTAKVEAQTAAGGIAGQGFGVISHSYWAVDTSNQNSWIGDTQ